MSLTHRPRVIINGIRRTRTYRFFWCRNCDRTVRITSSSDQYGFLCPLCYNLLRQEFHVSRPSLSASQLLDTMAQMIEPTLISRLSPRIPEQGPTLTRPNLTSPSPQQGPITSTFEEFMPVVRVTPDILQNDQNCPVCKEDFVVDEKICKMPCRHFYHSDCIIPWVRIHYTCPVCRYRIPVPQSSDNDANRGNSEGVSHYVEQEDIDDFRFEDVMNLGWPSWDELLSLWPFEFGFGSFFNWSFHDHENTLDDTASTSSGTGSQLNVFTTEI